MSEEISQPLTLIVKESLQKLNLMDKYETVMEKLRNEWIYNTETLKMNINNRDHWLTISLPSSLKITLEEIVNASVIIDGNSYNNLTNKKKNDSTCNGNSNDVVSDIDVDEDKIETKNKRQRLSVDSDSTKLSAEEKYFCVQQIINNKETTKSLADKYNIRRKTLSTWIAKYKRGKLNLSSGRPRIFDADSMQLLSSYVEENKDHLNVRQLGDYMEELYKNSITNSTTSNNNTTLIKPGKGINDVDTSDSGDSDTENKKDFCKKEDKRKCDQFKLSAKTKKRYIHLCLSGGLSKFIQGNSG